MDPPKVMTVTCGNPVWKTTFEILEMFAALSKGTRTTDVVEVTRIREK